ncbi:uncharacterized protein LOC135491436 [Lineus longissimus]|uniref:uncharacterized protein LOC135491436 n=1 Tax=Lineus longissimus TaxID=88925 RepID=UPI002B4C8C31
MLLKRCFILLACSGQVLCGLKSLGSDLKDRLVECPSYHYYEAIFTSCQPCGILCDISQEICIDRGCTDYLELFAEEPTTSPSTPKPELLYDISPNDPDYNDYTDDYAPDESPAANDCMCVSTFNVILVLSICASAPLLMAVLGLQIYVFFCRRRKRLAKKFKMECKALKNTSKRRNELCFTVPNGGYGNEGCVTNSGRP